MNQAFTEFKIYPEIIKSISLDMDYGNYHTYNNITGVVEFHEDAVLPDGLDSIYIVYGDINKEIIVSSIFRYNDLEQQTFIAQANVPYYFIAQNVTTWYNKSATSNKIEIET